MFTPQIKEALKADIPRDCVKTRQQAGENLSYLTGHYVIDRANEVFGPDGWIPEVQSITEVYRGTRPGRDAKDGDHVVIVWSARVRITAHGVVREDVGAGSCDCAPRNIAQAVEKGQKEAVTDGIKRALRLFGNSLGLALYDKEGSGIGHSTLALEMIDEVREARDVDAWVGANRDTLNSKRVDDLERDAIRAAIAARRLELVQAPAPSLSPPANEAPANEPTPPPSPAPSPAPVQVTPAVAAVMKRLGACHAVDEVVAVLLSSGVPADAKPVVWRTALTRAVAIDGTVTEEALFEDVARSKGEVPEPKPWGVWAELQSAVWGAPDLAAVDAAVRTHGAAVKALPSTLLNRANGLTTSARLRLRAERAANNDELRALYEELRAAVEAGKVTESAAAWLTGIFNAEAPRVAGRRAA
jgi:DNA recombination protein Rad52